jgi:hypothetical protein
MAPALEASQPHPPACSRPAAPCVCRDARGRAHYLHVAVTPRAGQPPQVAYYFSVCAEPAETLAPLPPHYRVVVSPCTGRPYARKA